MTENRAEPTDCETLNIEPEHKGEHVISQTFAIGIVEKNVTSIIMAKIFDKFPSVFCHLTFTPEETDMIIKGLQEAKERWNNM
ncbi:MAG: hypothetical protein WC554_16285 [Clostridia bacterium]|jgi:hypothetical protein